eukprot:4573567-Pyramimonas_sp.AAC.1
MRKEELSKMEDKNLDDMDKLFICNMGITKEGVEVERGIAFTSYRALSAHQQQAHRCRSVLGLLTRTNQRPWCRTVFASWQVAVDHVMAATEGNNKTCYANYGRWEHELIIPDNLNCSLCSFVARDLE